MNSDTKRLRWLCETLAFDGIGDGMDVHDHALLVAFASGHEEPTGDDYWSAYQIMIDIAMEEAQTAGNAPLSAANGAGVSEVERYGKQAAAALGAAVQGLAT
jgi:hypothetical protein